MSPECQTPPTVSGADFEAVNITDQEEIRRRFSPFRRKLHAYLNQMPCLRDLQQARGQWTRPRESEAFGNFATDPRHWYTFNHGGRTEAQFNVGLWPTYLRVGLGFEFTPKQGGDPTRVGLTYSCFLKVVREKRSPFERFVADNWLEIEWSAKDGEPNQFVPTGDVVQWLLDPPREPAFIFIGRLLQHKQDAAVLEDANALGKVMEAVFRGFRPFWEQTQIMARACR